MIRPDSAEELIPTASTSPSFFGRRESALICFLLLLACAFRAWGVSGLGLVHFDEGVYAISGMWTTIPNAHLYEKQLLFSPPLFFSLVGGSYWIAGEVSDKAAILVSVIVGAMTVVLVWWVTKRWFGSSAALAAAGLVALSDFHIAYSRMVLTDVTFSFFYLLSLALLAATLETGRIRWAILAGLSVGAAWNTKYHGWFLLLLIMMVLAARMFLGQQERLPWKRLMWCLTVTAAVAVACYLPWVAYVESQLGGYVSLMRYQKGFLSLNWPRNLWLQAEMQSYMDGWLSRIAPAAAFLLAWAVRRTPLQRDSGLLILISALLLASGIVLGGSATVVALGLLAIPLLVQHRTFLGLLLLGSLGLFFLVAPLYRPYPRLLLPWVLCATIVAGVAIGWIVDNGMTGRGRQWLERATRQVRWLIFGATVILVAALTLFRGFPPAPRTWMATDSVREAVNSMVLLLPKDSTVFVHGAPEVAFYLLLADRKAIPIDDPIDHQRIVDRFHPGGGKHFLVTGIYSQREPRSRKSLVRLRDRLVLIGVFPVEPNDVRLLNDFSPVGAHHYRLNPSREYALRVYKITAPANANLQPGD